MATKAQVLKLLAKQGAKWEIEKHDPFTFSAWLPEHLIWDSGYGTGLVTQEREYDETMSDFWSGVMCIIDAEVIAKQ
jgi:hypothetical protein